MCHRTRRGYGVSKDMRRARMLDRRVEVAELMKRRIPVLEMARRLGVADRTIQRDVKAILRTWAEKVDQQAEHLRARESMTLDHLELVAQLNMEKALSKRQALEDQGKSGNSAQAGDQSRAWERYDRSARAWFEERLKIQERRAKLLNLDQHRAQESTQVAAPITFIQVNAPEGPRQLAQGEVIEGEVDDDD